MAHNSQYFDNLRCWDSPRLVHKSRYPCESWSTAELPKEFGIEQSGLVSCILSRFDLWQGRVHFCVAMIIHNSNTDLSWFTLCWDGFSGLLGNLFNLLFTVPSVNCSIPLACVSLALMDLALASRASNDHLSLFDEQFWMIVDFFFLSTSGNSHLAADLQSLVVYWLMVSPDIWAVIWNFWDLQNSRCEIVVI